MLTHGSLVVLAVAYFGLLLWLPLWVAFLPYVYVLHYVGILLHEYFHGIPFISPAAFSRDSGFRS